MCDGVEVVDYGLCPFVSVVLYLCVCEWVEHGEAELLDGSVEVVCSVDF